MDNFLATKTALDGQSALHDVKDENSEICSDSPSDESGNNHDLSRNGPTTTAGKCLQKCPTFPVSASSDGKGCSRSLSMPIPRKVVSAIKGSREKEGIPQQKLSVSWAPDVYDPLPTSVSHFPRKKNQQQYSKNHKKNRKAKQKGKNTAGEKKHHRKTGGKSDRPSNSYANIDKGHQDKSSFELLDFNDPAPDPNCGSTFLGQASGTMHCVY